MQEKNYRELFKQLIKAYYEGVFEKKVEEIITTENVDKKSFARVVSAICGVEVEYSQNFLNDLKKAIKNYKKTNKVIINTHSCVKDCIKIDGKTVCQNACPFDAIILNKETSLPEINIDNCVNCGICVDSCKEKNFIDKIEFLPIVEDLRKNEKIVAAVAPSIAGQFGKNVSMGQIRAGIKRIGFFDMIEVAFFADMISIKEAVEFDRHISQENDFMISSCCCPIWVGMIKEKYKQLIKYTSPSVSPMIAAGKVIKAINPKRKVVFIGPCIAKKAEAKMEDIKDSIDYVLTYTELKDIFNALNIKLEKLPEELSAQYSSKGGRTYGKTGGVSLAVKDAVKVMFPNKLCFFSSSQADGIKECKNMIQEVLDGKIKATFLEGMGCEGGCIGGPKTILPKEEGKKAISNYGEESKIEISINNKMMKEFLKKINIYMIEDFKDKDKISIFERKF